MTAYRATFRYAVAGVCDSATVCDRDFPHFLYIHAYIGKYLQIGVARSRTVAGCHTSTVTPGSPIPTQTQTFSWPCRFLLNPLASSRSVNCLRTSGISPF